MNTRPKRANKVFMWMVLLTILLGCELLRFVFTKLRPELFDWRETFLSRLRAEDFQRTDFWRRARARFARQYAHSS